MSQKQINITDMQCRVYRMAQPFILPATIVYCRILKKSFKVMGWMYAAINRRHSSIILERLVLTGFILLLLTEITICFQS